MEEQLNMMRRGRQFKQLMNKKMDGIIPVSGIRQQIFIVILI